MTSSVFGSVLGVGVGGLSILLAIVLVFEVWMFVDLLQNKKLPTETKLLWAAGMLLIHPIVAVVYYFVARSTKN